MPEQTSGFKSEVGYVFWFAPFGDFGFLLHLVPSNGVFENQVCKLAGFEDFLKLADGIAIQKEEF